MKRKVYYFRCRRCHRRKRTDEECLLKPGVCQKCYAKEKEFEEMTTE